VCAGKKVTETNEFVVDQRVLVARADSKNLFTIPMRHDKRRGGCGASNVRGGRVLSSEAVGEAGGAK
jgi:hypothetical protein